MQPEELVQRLIRTTIQRAIQEGLACVLVLAAFTAILFASPAGTPQFYGCLIILAGTGFVAGVLWSFTLSSRHLARHPATDAAYWREAFEAQARLLRLVPVWYLTPLLSGACVFAIPTSPSDLVPFAIILAAIILMGIFATWLNRRAAQQIEEEQERYCTSLIPHSESA